MEGLTSEDPSGIGPYRLFARLGEGGMGRVYLARSPGGDTVAVKLVRREIAAQDEFRRRFTREVRAARRVGGRWTASVLDADVAAEVPWLATEYVPGPTLRDVVKGDFGPLPSASAHVLANRMGLALAAIHGAGLVHRDLKPSNILLTTSDVATACRHAVGLTECAGDRPRGGSPRTAGPAGVGDRTAGDPLPAWAGAPARGEA